jgi:penicillin-binding protein 1C
MAAEAPAAPPAPAGPPQEHGPDAAGCAQPGEPGLMPRGPVRRSPGRGRIVRWLAAAMLALLLVLDQAFPPPLPPPDSGMVVLARDGSALRQWPGADGRWRHAVTPGEVSPLYLQALLAYEDRWFHWHPGINPGALARAAWQWWRHGSVVSGGSTLTMQVARILDPPAGGRTRSLWAKGRQMLRALQLELRLSKREILTLYLNHAPMGGIVEGVEMASRAYLGKSSRELSHAEAALLTALPQSPSRLRPDRAPRAAQQVRDKVLARMMAQGVWSVAQVADARIETVVAQPLRSAWLAPLAAQRVRDTVRGPCGQRRSPGSSRGHCDPADDAAALPAIVPTTLDAELQATVEQLLLDRVHLLPHRVSMATLVIDNDSLEVLAYAGSADFADRERAAHVDMVRGVRSPGSTLKPFLYAMALDDGLIHSESLMVDAPQSFSGYEPGNFQASFNGPVSVSEALQRSLNVPAVDLLDRLGPARLAAQLRSAGMKLRMPAHAPPNLSLILGGAGTTLEELVGAYRALARGGLAGRPRLLPDAPRQEARVMSEGAAFIVRDILEGGGHPDRPLQEESRRVAWKTGTSFGFRDAWAVGVTDRYTMGVWVGRPDGTPNPGFFGANVAAPLVHDLVAALPADAMASRKPPTSVSVATTCWPLGLRADVTPPGACEVRRTGWVLQGTAPPTLPDRERSDGLLQLRPVGMDGAGAGDPAAALLEGAVAVPGAASSATPAARSAADDCGGRGEAVSARWPVALQPWLAHRPCHDADNDTGTPLRISGLSEGARLKPVPGTREVKLTVQAQGDGRSGTTVHWLVDGQSVQNSRVGEPVQLRFGHDGRYRVTALDGRGHHHAVSVTVTGTGSLQ